jgi:hypothetical protein
MFMPSKGSWRAGAAHSAAERSPNIRLSLYPTSDTPCCKSHQRPLIISRAMESATARRYWTTACPSSIGLDPPMIQVCVLTVSPPCRTRLYITGFPHWAIVLVPSPRMIGPRPGSCLLKGNPSHCRGVTYYWPAGTNAVPWLRSAEGVPGSAALGHRCTYRVIRRASFRRNGIHHLVSR